MSYSAETDSHGCAMVSGLVHPDNLFLDPEVELRTERSGYKPLQDHKPFGAYRIDVTLEPTNSKNPSSAVWTATPAVESLGCD